MTRRAHGIASSGLALLLGVFLAGCGSAAAEPEPTDAFADDLPGWPDDFARFRDDAATDLERRILADDVITEEELRAAEDAFVVCAARAGFTVTDIREGGGHSIDGPFTDDGPPALKRCDDAFYHTSGLYWMIQKNPEGIDFSELMAACLQRAGLVDDGFTAEEFLEGLGEEPLTVSNTEFVACNSSPTTAYTE